MNSDAHVRAVREREVAACVAAVKIELIGTGEYRRVSVGPGD